MDVPATEPTEPRIDKTPRVWVQPLATLFALAAALVFIILFLDAFSTVLLGLLAAAIVACTLNPIVRLIPAPRAVGAAVAGLGFIAAVVALLLALSWPLARPIKKELQEWPQNKTRIDGLLGDWSRQMALEEPVTVDGIFNSIGEFFAGESGPRLFSRGADVAVAIVIWLAFVFIGSIFMLADPNDRLLRPALRVVSAEHRPRVVEMLEALGPRLRRWVLGTFTSMCIVFTASWIGFAVIRLDFALPLALLAGLCEIVPTVGPACAMVVAVLFAATEGAGTVVGVLFVYAVIQAIEAYVILPMIMRGAVKVHPAVTLFSVVLWGKIFGVPGLMLAIPINLTIASMVDYLYIRPRDAKLPDPELIVRRDEPVGV
jgi:predicted PurR-regulated permease PerM